jgi:hypothetical protein
MVVSFEAEVLGGSHLWATHWNLSELDEHHMPELIRHQILPKHIFEHEDAILPGYKLLEYMDEPIEIRRNSYSHPMDSFIYDYYTSHLMNSSRHRKARKHWLWESFRKKMFGAQKPLNGSSFVREISRVRDRYPAEWSTWRHWCRNMLPEPEPEAAGELIFFSSYNKPCLIRYPWT